MDLGDRFNSVRLPLVSLWISPFRAIATYPMVLLTVIQAQGMLTLLKVWIGLTFIKKSGMASMDARTHRQFADAACAPIR
jgi:hypothetical protein